MQKAKFITIEGIEGAGKSTQIKYIAKYLKNKGIKALITREPGGTKLGKKIRQILLDKDTGNITASAELLLMFADRIEHIETKIKPALADNIWVISDRFIDSSYGYQGGGRGIDFNYIEQLENLVLTNFKPDLSLFLDITLKKSLERMKKRSYSDRFENENNVFYNNVFIAFKKRIILNKQRIKIINANSSIKNTKEQIFNILDKLCS